MAEEVERGEPTNGCANEQLDPRAGSGCSGPLGVRDAAAPPSFASHPGPRSRAPSHSGGKTLRRFGAVMVVPVGGLAPFMHWHQDKPGCCVKVNVFEIVSQ
jgi:hypothetical protein